MTHIVLALIGPTASGKSALALRYATCYAADYAAYLQHSHKRQVEIISMDSAQIYQGMDIGTAKPSKAERRDTPHHLIDIASPTTRYNVARFVADYQDCVSAIVARGNIPLLVGGTMMYFSALLKGLQALPSSNANIRHDIREQARVYGWAALHQQLSQLDPISAQRIHPSDQQRIERALEVYRLQTPSPHNTPPSPATMPTSAPQKIYTVSLFPQDRVFLHHAIAQRLEHMWDNGLVEEVRQLRQQYGDALHPDLPSMRCIAYRQVWQYLDGEYNHSELKLRTLFATRQFAKRQLTWLRQLPHDVQLDPQEGEATWQRLKTVFDAQVANLYDA